jgi:hypothetical protein
VSAVSLAARLLQERAEGKVQSWHRDRLAVVYLLSELQRISADQQAERSSRRIMVLSGMPESAVASPATTAWALRKADIRR